MTEERLLTDKTAVLEKFSGKGGWTFVRLPEIASGKNSPFGWVRVRGTIDHYKIRSYHLQSMGNGMLFLPVKAGIRNTLKKQAGDIVRIILYEDNTPTEIPEELKHCLQDVPGVYEAFLSYSNGEKKTLINWIYMAKTDKTKVERIVKTINEIHQKIK